jgi:hypothetical protein
MRAWSAQPTTATARMPSIEDARESPSSMGSTSTAHARAVQAEALPVIPSYEASTAGKRLDLP